MGLSLMKSHLFLFVTSRHGLRRKHLSSVAVQLLLNDGMTYSIVARAAIGTVCGRKRNSSVVVYGPLPSNGWML
jgi:hypothetical protein